MTKLLVGGFLIIHGLIHLGVWATPKPDGPQPFDPSHSWFFSLVGIGKATTRTLSIILAIGAAVGFVASGIALFAGSELWRLFAIVTAAETLLLLLLYFNPWLSFAVAIQFGIFYALVIAHWPAESVVGA